MPLQTITVGSRQSPLAQAQVWEVLEEIQKHHPLIQFQPVWTMSRGDLDLNTSIRNLEKTDFFTREIDELVLSKKCRIAIHSAKDLPDPLALGLVLAAVTTGLDPADVLVLRPGQTIETLPSGARIATSSVRREETVKQLRKDLQFVDVRGTITQRLEKLETGEADGVVIAEAALLRLGLTNLNRVRLPGTTVENQGKLAVVAREKDQEMQELFACIDRRR